jgi:L-threonylcarbamoyladenylate synthase
MIQSIIINSATEIPEAVYLSLQQDGVVLHATETVYGLTCRWDSEAALQKVAHIKQRPPQQPYSLMVGDVDTILSLIGSRDSRLRDWLNGLYPAPITLLLPRKKAAPISYWNQFSHLGFRIPDDPVCQALCRTTGLPLITTSANLSGDPPPVAIHQVVAEIRDKVDWLLDSGACRYRVPSTIVQLSENFDEYKLIREGAFSVETFDNYFRQLCDSKK